MAESKLLGSVFMKGVAAVVMESLDSPAPGSMPRAAWTRCAAAEYAGEPGGGRVDDRDAFLTGGGVGA